MKSTGRFSRHEEIENNPSEPFLKDIRKDIKSIDKHYLSKTAIQIKINVNGINYY